MIVFKHCLFTNSLFSCYTSMFMDIHILIFCLLTRCISKNTKDITCFLKTFAFFFRGKLNYLQTYLCRRRTMIYNKGSHLKTEINIIFPVSLSEGGVWGVDSCKCCSYVGIVLMPQADTIISYLENNFTAMSLAWLLF